MRHLLIADNVPAGPSTVPTVQKLQFHDAGGR